MSPESDGGEAARSARPAATPPLFRAEVLRARRERALGGVMLAQPLSTRILTAAAVAIAAGLMLFAFRGEYTRKARVRGYVVPSRGLIKVYAPEAGTIVERQVVEGQRVSRGDVLFVVSMERRSVDAVEANSAAIASLRERRASLGAGVARQDDMARIEARSLRQRVSGMEAELAQLAQELATQERRVAVAAGIHASYRELRDQSLASEEQVQQKQQELLDQQGRLQALRRSQIATSRELETLRSELPQVELKAKTQQGALERDIAVLEQELAEYESRRTVVVTAPAAGTATALLADRGHAVNPSQPLVSILPAGALLEAHLLVPSHSIGFLAPNQTVAVRYEAFPYQRFGSYVGHITEVSRTLILPNEAALPLPLAAPAYRVTVALDSQQVKAYGREFPLQAGMLLDADVWLDRRRLYEWLLDPLYSVLGRI